MPSPTALPAAAPAPPAVTPPSADFVAFVTSMTAALEAGTSQAAQFPDKSDLMFHRTLDRKFAKGIDASGERVLKLADRLLQLTVESQPKSKNPGRAKPRRKLADEDDVVDSFQTAVVDQIDHLLEDADIHLDEVNGKRKKAAIELKPSARAMVNLPGPATDDSRLSKELSLDCGMAKPQLLFEDAVNNSPDFRWTPTLKEKAHAMVPLNFEISSDEDWPMADLDDSPKSMLIRERRERARRHPYYYETRHLPYPTSLFTHREPIQPKSFDDTPFDFVDTPEKLEELTNALLQAKEIAFDLEYHSIRSYYGFTCLMQVSTRDHDWVIDTLALRSQLREGKLGGVLADPSVVKVFHGAESDIVWLQQDFDIYVVNLFDTFHAAKTLEFPKLSLASLLELYCQFEADKKYQMADWRIRPLSQEMMQYARADTHYLLFIYDSLRNALIARSSRTPSPALQEGEDGASTPKPNPQRAIRQVLDLSAETALKLHARDGYDAEKGYGPNGWANLAKKLVGTKTDMMKQPLGFVFKRLHRWRDTLARDLDESPHYILPNHTLNHLAQTSPTRRDVLSRVLTKQAPNVLSRVDELVMVIKAGIADHIESLADGIEAQSALQKKHITPGQAPSVQALSSTPATIPAPAPTRTVDALPAPKRARTHIPVDVWGDLINNKQVKPIKPTTSTLFGKTLPASTSTSGSAPAPSSSLFGRTLDKAPKRLPTESTRQSSPGFASVRTVIHSALQKSPIEGTTVDPTTLNPFEPESIAFVPAGERKIAKSESTSTSSIKGKGKASEAEVATQSAPSKPAPVVDADGVVSVRKQKKSKQEKAAAKAASGSALESAGGSRATTPVERKAKLKPSNIPVFDYAAEPNLLDQPSASTTAPQKKGKKKEKGGKDKGKDKGKSKPKSGTMPTSGNRRPPVNPSEPKSGNKSGTFAG